MLALLGSKNQGSYHTDLAGSDHCRTGLPKRHCEELTILANITARREWLDLASQAGGNRQLRGGSASAGESVSMRVTDGQGWAWADVGPAIEEITLAMERLQPTPEQLVAFASQPSNANTYRFAKQRVEEDERDSAAVTAALRFWPPV